MQVDKGRERSVQLRANKRGFFKIASHILENHRLLLRSCFLNAVDKGRENIGQLQ